MRWNDAEVAQLAQQPPEWEGRLNYQPPTSKSRTPFSGTSEPRDRWFRLRANFLFYFRLSPMYTGRPASDAIPIGMFVLERFHVQQEGFENAAAFSIIFSDEPTKKHFFVAETDRHARQWEAALKKASYQKLREQLIGLQLKMANRTGVDPLEGTVFANNPAFSRHSPMVPRHEVPNDIGDAGISSAAEALPPSASPLPPPRPKNRKNRATFQSHVVTNWEQYSPVAGQTSNNNDDEEASRKASFKSHIDVPTGNLLDL